MGAGHGDGGPAKGRSLGPPSFCSVPVASCLLLTPGVSTIEGCVLRLGMEKLKDRYQSWIWPHKMETEAAMYALWNSRHLGGVWVKGGFSLRGPRR